MRMHEIVMEIPRFLVETSLFKRSFVYASLFFVAAASKNKHKNTSNEVEKNCNKRKKMRRKQINSISKQNARACIKTV